MDREDNRCYATIRESEESGRSYISLNDDLECFGWDTSVVIITEVEHERLLAIEAALNDIEDFVRQKMIEAANW